MMNQKWKLLYDGECDLCIRFAHSVKQFDKNQCIDITPYQIHFESDNSIPLKELEKEVHLVNETEILKGPDAITKIVGLIPETKPLQWMIESKVGQKGTGFLYKMVNRFRKRNCKTCNKKKNRFTRKTR
jgi:predicted DCC family thiol-disulfide oxidoreductase YuxK